MDAEHLKYFVALQPFFLERMGEWQHGDEYYIPDSIPPTFGQYSDHCKSCQFEAKTEGTLRIPRPIDDRNPEAQRRSLWGMVKGDTVVLYRCKDGSSIVTIKWQGKPDQDYYADTSTLAILKALAAQWKVTV